VEAEAVVDAEAEEEAFAEPSADLTRAELAAAARARPPAACGPGCRRNRSGAKRIVKRSISRRIAALDR
jgi:hypothetical protein